MELNMYEFLQKIAFPRESQSENEIIAGSYIRDYINDLERSADFVKFDVTSFAVDNVRLFSNQQEYPVIGIKGSGTATDLTASLYFMENSSDQDSFKLKGKIVLIEGSLDVEKYTKLIKCGAAGFLTYDKSAVELDERFLKIGKIPGMIIDKENARQLIKDNPLYLTMSMEQKSIFKPSYYLVSEIRGTKYPTEIILLSSTLDTEPDSIGAHDCGSGCVMLLKLYEYFVNNPPKRTVRFIWFGSEKCGLRGTKNYLEEHEQVELDRIMFNFNIDKCGLSIGKTTINVYAEKALANYISYESKIFCFPIHVTSKTPLSNAIYFAKAGVPSLVFSKVSTTKEKEEDTMELITPEALDGLYNFLSSLLAKFINADTFPVKRYIPDDVKEKIDKLV